jgi:hypothetical protein
MSLATQIVSDVSAVFFKTADFGTSITYRRGGAAVTLTAIVESDVGDISATIGVTTSSTRTFTVIASQLILGAAATLPLPGDTITEGDTTYIVPKQRDRVTYESVDENNLILRINTTLMRTT